MFYPFPTLLLFFPSLFGTYILVGAMFIRIVYLTRCLEFYKELNHSCFSFSFSLTHCESESKSESGYTYLFIMQNARTKMKIYFAHSGSISIIVLSFNIYLISPQQFSLSSCLKNGGGWRRCRWRQRQWQWVAHSWTVSGYDESIVNFQFHANTNTHSESMKSNSN